MEQSVLSPLAGGESARRCRYAMIFALTPGLDSVLLLRKRNDHKNPLFRGRWTVPGGHIEANETDVAGAVRELVEESGLRVHSADVRSVLSFVCNCDPMEPEHDVVVFAVTVPLEELNNARGDSTEPVTVWPLPLLYCHQIWYLEPLLALVLGRMRQPFGVLSTPASGESR